MDKVIRLTKKYYKDGDTDYLPALNEARDVLEEKVSWRAMDLLSDLARYVQRSGKGTYEDIYKAWEVFGFIVEEEQE